MLHFPSSLKNAGPSSLPRRSDSLNATQQKTGTHPIFSTIEEELHDARRVHSHGQEDDLRSALNMVISRVINLSTLLSEAYKSQADLEVQLNVAKSNLQLVISNNEMLEEALKRDSSGHARDVGWRRWSAREGEQRRSEDRSGEDTPSIDSGTSSPVSTNQESRFFKFRFTGSTPNPGSRPGTPQDAKSPGFNGAHHLNSPSMSSLPPAPSKELEELAAELRKERAARKAVVDEKQALEAELESLSQALFEEANKMVATERIKRAETEEELKEAHSEREALRSALRLLEGENESLRGSSQDSSPVVPFIKSHSRSSSEIALKSAPSSPKSSRPPTPVTASLSRRQPTPSGDSVGDKTPGAKKLPLQEEEDSQITPQFHRPRPASLHLDEHEASPWADVRSRSPALLSGLPSKESSLFTAPPHRSIHMSSK
ncbi:hypothetical protein BDZ94DRAFT_89126 [Collybia nuda]|uniref:GDP/GTP exchange factor Sec2 N-terminal domain-containing protein n=1 Tax=Collybia nuda TaxID=64659 RepID=A0A9P5YDJ1_9AGAR|nr:hypothetical protein BDZ94DRAFT_89126 [Collybia nuda]